jgi:hypothetical protein
MRPILFPVIAATVYLFVYSYLAFTETWVWLVIWMFVLSPMVVIWMVYKVLKNGIPSTRTFDEYFYDDVDLQPVSSKLALVAERE